MATKYIFVTGGVTSSLGKGIISASLGKLLQARGYRVTNQKLDPYINVDPGTLNPYEHGECYVTVDGHEADLDLGHYERFIDENLNKFSNLTTGKVYWNVLKKERGKESHKKKLTSGAVMFGQETATSTTGVISAIYYLQNDRRKTETDVRGRMSRQRLPAA